MTGVAAYAPFVCIIGAPRSGTTWLHAMLGAHPEIATTHELKLFDLFTGPWAEAWQRLIDLQQDAGGGPRGLRLVWSDEEFLDVMRRVVADVHGRVLSTRPGARIVLDKSPGYSRYVSHIRTLRPDARFIHVLRDGRDVAVSLRAASCDWARTWAPTSVDSATSLWKSLVSAARDAEEQAPDHYLEVRYEQLHAEGPATLLKALDFAGVSAEPDAAASIYARHSIDRMRSGSSPFDLPTSFFRFGEVGRWRTELTLGERYRFDRAAGDLLVDLGYAREGWWQARPYQRWIVPLLAATSAWRRIHAFAMRFTSRMGRPDR